MDSDVMMATYEFLLDKGNHSAYEGALTFVSEPNWEPLITL